MKKELKGFMKIFHFTFRQQVRRRGWLLSTILVAVLCFAVPMGVLSAVAWFSQEEPNTPELSEVPEPETVISEETVNLDETVNLSALEHILVVNQTEREEFSAAALERSLAEMFGGTDFIEYQDHLETARIDSRGSNDMLVLVAEKEADRYVMHLLLPEESTLPEEILDLASWILSGYGEEAAAEINEAHGLNDLTGEAETETEMNAEAGVEAHDGLREILGFVIPYLNTMLLYFFVLFYGQGVAQSVITEKTSKLMEFFLISVRPSAMILGKLAAVCLCGIIQLGGWIICLLLGTAAGGVAALKISGAMENLQILQILDSFGSASGSMFSVSSIVLMLLMLAAGMFLYCSLAAVGGALAGKPEDLSSTNAIFTLVLVASFFACLLAGGLNGLDGGSPWLDWIPFTAVMVTPARILLGSVSLVRGAASLALAVLTTLLITMAAGRIYRMLVLHKGDVPGWKTILKMIK